MHFLKLTFKPFRTGNRQFDVTKLFCTKILCHRTDSFFSQRAATMNYSKKVATERQTKRFQTHKKLNLFKYQLFLIICFKSLRFGKTHPKF